MPLLNKKSFQKNIIPPGLKDTDKVFYCDVTNEIFDNYQEFAERIILCNSLVWACEETGKSGLTYSEAVECERNAKKLLHKFPAELRKPILYLITLTNRTALSELSDEIFCFVRERFFVGETVEYNIQGDQWIRCRIQRVLAPSSKDLADVKNGIKPNDKLFWPPGSTYHYDLEMLSKPEGSKYANNVGAVKLRRIKSTYTRDRNHLFIKHFVSKIDGLWRLKPNVFKRYDVHKIKFDEIFAGAVPKFPKSESPKKPTKKSFVSTGSSSLNSKSPNKGATPANKAKKQESIDKYLKPKVVDGSPSKRSASSTNSADKNKNKQLNNSNSNAKKTAEKRKSTEEILERELNEKRKKMMEHQQQLIEKKQRKQLDIQRKRDEKKKLEEFVKEWSKTREDLELEDLRELPCPVSVHLNTPNEYFGEIVMLYEFFQSFCQQVNTKNFFPAGITIDLIDRAIAQQEIAGPLCDFIHLLMAAIFRMQEEEEDEVGESYDLFAITNFDTPNVTAGDKLDFQSASVGTSEAAINWSIAFQGVPIAKLGVDATTISEILRLHFLSAGARVSETCTRWRVQEKGGFTPNDDPAVFFRQENEHIIRMLSEHNVGVLPPKDKVAILECLINQIVMHMGMRNLIFDNVETYRQKRVELRLALAAEIRKEKELLQKKKKSPQSSDTNAAGSDGIARPTEESASLADSVSGNNEVTEKLFKDIQRKKDDLRKQLDDLMAETMKVQLAPLGMDRAYRRFWVFPSLPGVFVEDNEQKPPPCLPRGTPVPNAALLKEKDSLSYVKKLFQKEYNKENLGTFLSFGSPKKTNGNEVKEETNRLPLTCWGDNEACPIHSNSVKKVKWSYFRTESELDNLLNTLNTRGKRESKLKALLTQHREAIVKNLAKYRINLNKLVLLDGDDKDVVIETRKSSRGNPTYEDAMFNYPAETDVEEVLGALLRNTIISVEERSNAGGLGNLKVFNREAWIEAIKNNSYEKSCGQLTWGPTDEILEEAIEKDLKMTLKSKEYTNLEKFETLNKYVTEPKQNVRDMACAILQLEQSIELHYLKPPLGAEKTRHHPSKASCTDLLKRWEASLMKCTSFAQLFIHLNTLENSIAWNRSAQNAHCRICRRRGDAQNMLLCDSCNKGHHMYCLKPKLTKVPKGDWFCTTCRPPVKEPRERKKVVYAGDSDEEFCDRKSNIICMEKMEPKDKGKCKVCSERGMTIGCSKCHKRYHLNCLLPPLRKPPTINWACHSCRQMSARKDEESSFMVNGHRRRTRHSLESNYTTQLPLDNATLQELLIKITHHEDAWPFLKAVSRYEAADYFQIIKRPMDFATIRHKLNMLEYHMNSQVISDSMLVFHNCFLYNKETSDIYQAGVRLLAYFKELCKEFNLSRELEECENQLSRPARNVHLAAMTNGAIMKMKEVPKEDADDEEMDKEGQEDEEMEEDEDEQVDDEEGQATDEEEEEEEETENAETVDLEDDEVDSLDGMGNVYIQEENDVSSCSSDDYHPTKKIRTS